jgi:hypothetical protein
MSMIEFHKTFVLLHMYSLLLLGLTSFLVDMKYNEERHRIPIHNILIHIHKM